MFGFPDSWILMVGQRKAFKMTFISSEKSRSWVLLTQIGGDGKVSPILTTVTLGFYLVVDLELIWGMYS